MKLLPIFIINLLLFVTFGCGDKQSQNNQDSSNFGFDSTRMNDIDSAYSQSESIDETVLTDELIKALAPYRDTLIGKFNGKEIDTLIAEPIPESLVKRDSDTLDVFAGHYYRWKVYTTKGTVKTLFLDGTISVKFVKEGDLDGNGTNEWGYLHDWPMGTWTGYQVFTCVDGEWIDFIGTHVWMGHLDETPIEKIVQPSKDKRFIKVKFSDIRNDGRDFLLIDTLFQVDPQN